MTLLFFDGFTHYTDILDKWDFFSGSPTFQASGGRFFGDSLQFNSAEPIEKFFGTGKDELVVGFAFKPVSSPSSTGIFMEFTNGDYPSNGHASLQFDSVTRNFDLYTSGVFRGSTSTWLLGEWRYVEMKIKVGDPTGTYEVKVDGVTELSATGTDTVATSGEDKISIVRLGVGSSNGINEIDDVYILDTAGSVNNDFLGAVTVETLSPTSDGTTTNFTRSSGTANYEMVDDAAPDGDTTYNSSSTATNKDTFGFENMTTVAGTIHGVQTYINGRKQDAGLRELSDVIRHSATDYDGTSSALNQGYYKHTEVHETNPGTATAWTISDVNGAEFGYKIQT
ncbi:MAG: hypothetical protein ACW99G_03230 [Candidatus Thorarchaeota archaeon]|jgi:hypothetical protein